MRYAALLVPVVLAATVVTSSAQALGDIARQEQERRKAAPAGKVYTDGNLKSVPAATVPAGAAAAPAAVAAEPAAAADVPAAAPTRDQKFWRDRLQAERDGLQRAEMFAEALQSRINALSTDFVSRDDPAQRSTIAKDRDKALAELGRVKEEIAQHGKAIAGIQEEARRAGIPAGWVRWYAETARAGRWRRCTHCRSDRLPAGWRQHRIRLPHVIAGFYRSCSRRSRWLTPGRAVALTSA